MTEKQIELYKETKRRLRRIGIENPAEVIVALAEEIDHYRKKIRAMEEQIASKNETKRGDGTAIAQALRSKQSRDNRELLDRAADRIDELEAGYRKQSEVVEEYRQKVNEKMGKHTHLLGKEYVQRILREVAKEMKGGAE